MKRIFAVLSAVAILIVGGVAAPTVANAAESRYRCHYLYYPYTVKYQLTVWQAAQLDFGSVPDAWYCVKTHQYP